MLLTPLSNEQRDPKLIIQSELFIRYDRNYWGGRLVETYLRKMKIKVKEHIELDSLEAIAILVDRGLGVSLVPDWLQSWPEGISVRKLNIVDAPTRDIGIMWSRGSTRLPLIRAFSREVFNVIRSQAGDPNAS